MSDENRPSALLTDRQRRYLRGELTPSNPRQMRSRIRKRLTAGLADGWLLHENLSDKDVRLVFGDGYAEPFPDAKEIQADGPRSGASPAVPAGILGFIMRGLNYENAPLYPGLEEIGDGQPALAGFIEACETAVAHYLETHLGYSATVAMNIELTDLRPHEDFFSDE